MDINTLNAELHKMRMEIVSNNKKFVWGKFPCEECALQEECKKTDDKCYSPQKPFHYTCHRFLGWQRSKDALGGQMDMLNKIQNIIAGYARYGGGGGG